MNKQKSKQKGITLIALVVTIIILIILAGVSINMVVGNNGIITQAQRVARETANVTIASEEQMNALVEEMNEYMSENNMETIIPVSKLEAGNYIKYDTGVEGVGVITCRVLYPANFQYGLQIISDKSVETITLGGSTFEEGRISYNNAIETLNNAAEKYRNAEYATDVRCVGSMPTVENGVFINKNSETAGPTTLPFLFNGSTSIDCKGEDTNYTTDQEQMQDLEILMTGQSYWLASRNVHSNSSSICYFNVRAVFSTTGLNADCLCRVYTGEPSSIGLSPAYGLRPCILLKTDIKLTGGDGKTEETAYIIQ